MLFNKIKVKYKKIDVTQDAVAAVRCVQYINENSRARQGFTLLHFVEIFRGMFVCLLYYRIRKRSTSCRF